jgi:hypothetical protein
MLAFFPALPPRPDWFGARSWKSDRHIPCNKPLFACSSFQPFTRPCTFTSTLAFLRSSPHFAAPLIYLCYIFLSFPFSVIRVPSRADVLPFFPFVFPSSRCSLTRTASALPLFPCVHHTSVRSLCALRKVSLDFSLVRISMHALVFICARALSHLPLY